MGLWVHRNCQLGLLDACGCVGVTLAADEPPSGAACMLSLHRYVRPPLLLTHWSEETFRAVATITSSRDDRPFRGHSEVVGCRRGIVEGIWAASGAGSFWPFWPIVGWGVGLAGHAGSAYGQQPFTEDDVGSAPRGTFDPSKPAPTRCMLVGTTREVSCVCPRP